MTFRYVSKKQRYEVLTRQEWTCNNCGCPLKYAKTKTWNGEVAQIDHIHPYIKRKTYPKGEQFINENENLQALCPRCNKKKGMNYA